ncbi:MAG: hypothetical protein ACWGNO_14840, partial [Desulfobacterales bacterium]
RLKGDPFFHSRTFPLKKQFEKPSNGRRFLGQARTCLRSDMLQRESMPNPRAGKDPDIKPFLDSRLRGNDNLGMKNLTDSLIYLYQLIP